MPSFRAHDPGGERPAHAREPGPGRRRRDHPNAPRRAPQRCPPPDPRGRVEASLLSGRLDHHGGLRPARRPAGPGAGAERARQAGGSREGAPRGRRDGSDDRRSVRPDGPAAARAGAGRGGAPHQADRRDAARLGFRRVRLRRAQRAARRRGALAGRRAGGAARVGARRARRRCRAPAARGREVRGAAARAAVAHARGAQLDRLRAVGARAGQRRLVRRGDRGAIPDGRARGAPLDLRPPPRRRARGALAEGPADLDAALPRPRGGGARARHGALGRSRGGEGGGAGGCERLRHDEPVAQAAAVAGPLRGRVGDRPRLDGRGAPGARPGDRQARGREADPDVGAAHPERVGEVQGALLSRGARGGQAAAPGHRGDLRRRPHRRGRPVHRDGVRRGPDARGARRGAGGVARRGAAARDRVPRRARLRPLPGRRSTATSSPRTS